MQNFEQLRIRFLIDEIPAFFKGVRESKCNEEIRASARNMIDIIGESIFPGQKITIREDIAAKSEMDKAPSPVEKGKVDDMPKRNQTPIGKSV